MKLFVWQGGDVLRNYSSGLAVVVAPDLEAAWLALRAKNLSAWFQLQTGHFPYIESEHELEVYYLNDEDYQPREGFPIAPVVHELDDTHVFVSNGGE